MVFRFLQPNATDAPFTPLSEGGNSRNSLFTVFGVLHSQQRRVQLLLRFVCFHGCPFSTKPKAKSAKFYPLGKMKTLALFSMVFCFLRSQKWRMQLSICFDTTKTLACFFWFSFFYIAKRNGAPFNPLCEKGNLVKSYSWLFVFYRTNSGGCNFYSA